MILSTSSNLIVMSKKHEVKGQGIAVMHIGIHKIGHVPTKLVTGISWLPLNRNWSQTRV